MGAAGMKRPESFTLALQAAEHIVRMRQAVREQVTRLGFSLVDQTKIVTAASELARNTILHGGGGEVVVEPLVDGRKKGVRLTFIDQGPGIPDIDLALKDGYSTGSGLGLGLGGAKRLSNQFDIDSQPGRGTRISITRWG
jgi:serine/threonine-protein kinase RsbT